MAEDFTTYTEVDPNSHISKTASRIDFTNLPRNEDAYVYKDFGVDYFRYDFTINVDVRLTSGNDYCNIGVFSLCNYIDDLSNTGNKLRIIIAKVPSNIFRISLAEVYSGSTYYTTWDGNINTTYYLTIKYSLFNSAILLYIYSDSARTTILACKNLDLHSFTHRYRYLYGCSSLNDSDIPGYAGTGFVENLNIVSHGNIMSSFDKLNIENFTNYTEVDSSSSITVSTSSISITDSVTTASHVYLDKGTNHFTGIRIRFNTRVTGTTNGQTIICGVSNYAGNFNLWTTGLYIKWIYNGTSYNLILGDKEIGETTSIALNQNTQYYCELRKHGMWAELWISNDISFNSIIERMTIANLETGNTYNYLYGLSTNGTTASVASEISMLYDGILLFTRYNDINSAIPATASHDGETYPGTGWIERKPTGCTIEQSSVWKANGGYSIHIGQDVGTEFSTEDFTTYTEVDPNSHISKTVSTITISSLNRNEDAYVYKDFGVGFIGDIEILVDVSITSGTTGGIADVLTIANVINDCNGILTGSYPAINIELYKTAPGYSIYLVELYNGTSYYTSGYAVTGTKYLRLTRTGSTLSLYTYSESARTTLLSTLTLTLHSTPSFRYLYGVNTYNDGTNAPLSGTISNIAVKGVSAGLVNDFTASTNSLWCATGVVNIESITDGQVCYLFGVENTANGSVAFCGVYRSGSNYTWAILSIISGVETRTDSTYKVQTGVNYKINFISNKDPNSAQANGLSLLVNGDIVAQRSVDAFTPFYSNRVIIGHPSYISTPSSISSRYVDDFYFRKENTLRFGSLTKASDGAFIGIASLTNSHWVDTNASVKIIRSTDIGKTWTLQQTIDYSNKQDFSLANLVNVGNNIYLFVERGKYTSGNQLRTDVWKSTNNGVSWTKVYDADTGTPANLRIYTSKLVENNKILCTYLYTEDASKTNTYTKFVKFDTTTDTFDSIPSNYIAQASYFTSLFPTETYLYRRPSDNILIAMTRWDNYAATTYHGDTTVKFQSISESYDNGATWLNPVSYHYQLGSKAGRSIIVPIGNDYAFLCGYNQSLINSVYRFQPSIVLLNINTLEVVNEKKWSYGLHDQDTGNGDSIFVDKNFYSLTDMGDSLGFFSIEFMQIGRLWWERQRKRDKAAGRIR